MPLAGALMWTIIGVGGALRPPALAVGVLFICTGLTINLGLFLSRFTGENFMD